MILLLLLANLALGADTPKAATLDPKPHLMRYRHVFDADGKILATLDTKDGKIEYREDPKEVVKVLIGAIDNLSAQCQPPKVETPKKK